MQNMSMNLKMLASAIGAVLLVTPAVAKPRAHHHTTTRAAFAGPVHNSAVPAYDEMIVTTPNGRRVVGTDPDRFIRSQMRRDTEGPDGSTGSTGP
jgi:hypothetical protein